jgi:hypothetical protein
MNRKRLFRSLLVLVTVALTMVACMPEEDIFDEALLFGKWKTGSLFYRYDEDYSGVTWDTADDISEEEGQPFTWTLVKAELTQIHIMEMGGSAVPKVYIVTELTATTLKYKDDLTGKLEVFTKVR